jgi:hypothetical protein
MGEATRDNLSPAKEPKKDKERIRGWIRMHSNDNTKPPPVEEQQESEAQSPHPKPRKELEKPVE